MDSKKGAESMSKRAYAPEQIIQKLWEAEVELAQGATVGAICRKMGVTGRPTTSGGRDMAGL
jgi:hypothetical protein